MAPSLAPIELDERLLYPGDVTPADAADGQVWEEQLRGRDRRTALARPDHAAAHATPGKAVREGVGDPTVLKAFTMLPSVLSHVVIEGHLDHNLARAGAEAASAPRAQESTPCPWSWWSVLEQTSRARRPRVCAHRVSPRLGRLRTLNVISELQRRESGCKLLRVNARKTHRMRTVDMLPPRETDLRPSIAALADKSIGAPVMPRFDGTALTEAIGALGAVASTPSRTVLVL